MGFATDCIHAGQEPDPTTGAVSVPIYQTSTYVQEGIGKHKGYEYARTQNPTRAAWEKCMATLEGGRHGFAFSSGLAAISTILHLLKSGDHVVASDDMYGGTYRLFNQVFRDLGLRFDYIDMRDPGAIPSAIRPETRMLFLETPTNPLMRVLDLQAIGEVTRRLKVLFVVDNTFMTPYLLRPLELGADVVVYSATKFISGHNDVLAGLVVVREAELNADHLPGLSDPLGHGPERAGTDGDQRQAAQAVGGD